MSGQGKTGIRVVGIVFLALGVIKFLRGDDWVVWIILGILFGGLSALGGKKGSQES